MKRNNTLIGRWRDIEDQSPTETLSVHDKLSVIEISGQSSEYCPIRNEYLTEMEWKSQGGSEYET